MSEEDGAQPQDTDPPESDNNLLRLQSHLKEGSFARRLVNASIDANDEDTTPPDIISKRLEEVRAEYDTPQTEDD